ncbi:hypothetical protein HYH02_005130 [Chlamydomonas schloesseri]|uniref:Uncharacterized protein n=1 Tax=Chlamydomonas schloesseri TaxID=2026947 RepID=A0A835WLI7_9CHLO|nr:hypothetical protein HYH02_005130 [Chlamydomonas schloesseri]|eukprot:KAG2449597.1 hypothetical protein HYH02_005130 [Chlamydomonas schloesseri]
MPTPVLNDAGSAEPGLEGLSAMRSEPAYLPDTSRGRPVPGLGLGALALNQARGSGAAEDPGPPRTRRGPPLKPPMLNLINPASASPVPSGAPTPALGMGLHGPGGLHGGAATLGGPPAASGGRQHPPVRVELVSPAFMLQNLAGQHITHATLGGGSGEQQQPGRLRYRSGSADEDDEEGGADEANDDDGAAEREAQANEEAQGGLDGPTTATTSGRLLVDRCCSQLGIAANELTFFELRPLQLGADGSLPADCFHVGVTVRGSAFSLSALEEIIARSKRDEQLTTILDRTLQDAAQRAAEAKANAERLAKQSEEIAVLKERLLGLEANNQHLREQLQRSDEHRQMLGGTIRTIKKEFEDFKSRVVVEAPSGTALHSQLNQLSLGAAAGAAGNSNNTASAGAGVGQGGRDNR